MAILITRGTWSIRPLHLAREKIARVRTCCKPRASNSIFRGEMRVARRGEPEGFRVPKWEDLRVWEDHFRIRQLVSFPISRSLICEEGILAYSLYRFAFFVRYSPAESSPVSFAISRMASLSLTRA